MFYIGQIFSGEYPPEAAAWCNEREDCFITELASDTAEDGEVIRKFEIVAIAPPTFDEVKKYKLGEINAVANRVLSSLTATYPDMEVSTFDKQESEARAYVANPATPTPLLSALAKARGFELSELVERVIVKADMFAVLSGSIIGQRQALEDRLDTCTTIEEVQAIAVEITLPDTGGTA